jgi:hypothetical protein
LANYYLARYLGVMHHHKIKLKCFFGVVFYLRLGVKLTQVFRQHRLVFIAHPFLFSDKK